MKIYIISDTHFNHRKIIEFCNRPVDFGKQIIENLKIVKKDDLLIHLGDICIGKDKEIHDKIISKIGCRKILVRGNHDKKSTSWYLSNHWDFVNDSFSLTIYGFNILFTHRPVENLGCGVVNIHGHLHNSLHHDTEYILTERNLLFSLENESYKPVLLEQFLGRFKRFL